MNKYFTHPLAWFIAGLSFILGVYLIVAQFDTTNTKLEQAYASYKQGEQAATIGERHDAFNASLAIYKQMELQHTPTFGNGKIYYNIANNYLQLNEYPLAVLNYFRAQNLMPRDEKVKANLDTALTKLGLKTETTPSFSNRLSLPEKLQIFVLLTFLLFIAGILWIFYYFKGLELLITLLSACLFLLLANFFYLQFIAPSYAVILKANSLYKDAGLQYAKVLDLPVPPGTKVEVLDTVLGGKWLKIALPDGTIGFIPEGSLEII